MVNGVTFNFPPSTRENFVEYVKSMESFEDAIEEVAYTWFNRILAIRFMEVNGYLENGIDGENIHVIGSEDEGRNLPDAVAKATKLKYVDKEIVYKYQDDEDNAGLFRYILMKQCQELSQWMPEVFEKVSDFTDLLLPETLLLPGGLIEKLTGDLSAADFDISSEGNGQVEIFGWMYQFYIAEKKKSIEESNLKINKGNLPAKTQLFTPDWIVRYMTENTLGKLWVVTHDDSDLQYHMEYYLEPGLSSVNRKLFEELKQKYRLYSVRDIKFIDPCCGSGHILVYAFELFYNMYLEEGYSPETIPSIIFENNIYGLDVDKRAIQLTSFALTMKARSYNRRLFLDGYHFPNVIDICESNAITKEIVDRMTTLLKLADKDVDIVEECIFRFKDAEYKGSLVNNFQYSAEQYETTLNCILKKESDVAFETIFDETMFKNYFQLLCTLLKQAVYMNNQYDCVVTNPPYLSPGDCHDSMKKYASLEYSDSKNDMYAMFVERCLQYRNNSGLVGMVTMHGWMFQNHFSLLRNKLIGSCEIDSMIHLGKRAFEDISGEIVQTTTWVMSKHNTGEYLGHYFDLTEFDSQEAKKKAFLDRKNKYERCINDFSSTPDNIYTYWMSDKVIEAFGKYKPMSYYAEPKRGICTCANKLFYRFWFEVNKEDITLGYIKGTDFTSVKWIPLNKGGSYRKWYGNLYEVINWENNGQKIREYPKAQVKNEDYYFLPALTWSSISTSGFSVRYTSDGFICDQASNGLFPTKELIAYIHGLLVSKVSGYILKKINPSHNILVGDLARLPVSDKIDKGTIEKLVRVCIEEAKLDWDSFEMSWNFKRHPLLRGKGLISEAFTEWEVECNYRRSRVKECEEEINRLFISAYGLEQELTSEMSEEDITVEKANQDREIKSLISYAVGCVMGRYDLDEEGLAFAGGNWHAGIYSEKFKPCQYGIMPITEEQYFTEDLCTRVIDFIKISFGEKNLKDNLDYIASVLKPNSYEIPKKVIRNYLYNDFYNIHCKMFQNCPYYWQLDSGKSGGFRALVYMHRFNENTLSIVRTDYLQELRYKYEDEIQRLQHRFTEARSTADKNSAKKQATSLDRKLVECVAYDDLLNHVTGSIQNYVFDLDDGVKTNYAKFLSIDGDKTKNVLTVIKL